MPSFRFCRPDDIPLLVEAVNQCYDVHFPDAERLTLSAFQAEIRELDMWASNCMVARENDRPIGVLIAGKRPQEVLIRRLGVHPAFQGRGVGSHLLTSLSQKLAVLGPDRLIIELPHRHDHLLPFLQKNRYRQEATFYTYTLTAPPTTPPPPDLVIPFTLQDALDNDVIGAPEAPNPQPWASQLPSLKALAERLKGYAIASPDRIETYLLFTDSTTGTTIHRHGPTGSPPYLPILLSHTLATCPAPITLQTFSPLPNITPNTATRLLAAAAKPL
ncbi:MAG TPA: GNAT family N-acetyltransferase [Acidobacteriota bacterium]|nr:GNAT family N-acetyltransferase [Acidobacteriota bacterium]